ncbi:Transcription termination factor MT, chloroplastic [Sesamum angolense]|uniref:Transcription termination factor MT, chloroplastic n=1 Tax=Sesamum angolense TaxID=2727404 RepID=A0AAE1XEH9_9LAMI|nr:Transcription termination factor MT, chloroplastic [Sesamum angolense]
MKASVPFRSSGVPFLSEQHFSSQDSAINNQKGICSYCEVLVGKILVILRTELTVPQKVFFSRAKHDGSFSLRLVPPTLLAAEKEEAKAVLTLFLKKQGLSNAVAARTINKSDLFVDHLVSRLHSVHKSRYLVGRELTTLEIRDALIPYLETLLDEYGPILVDVVENFPDPPVKEKSEENVQKQPLAENLVASVSPSTPSVDSRKLKALARVSDVSPTGKLPSHIVYLIELGMEIEAIREVIRKFPAFAYYSLEGKIKPVVEFLLDLGVPKADIPTILTKRPQLCGISLTENLIPTMAFLEELGVDKKQWAKVIYRFPHFSLTADKSLKQLVEDKLRPTADYFRSLGVNVALLLHRSPQTFGLSIEGNLKPVTEFFLERGYSLGDVATMISRYGALYTFSLPENLMPKWEFFLMMVYPKSELIKFPQYFGYSLEDRIKPRYETMRKCGVQFPHRRRKLPIAWRNMSTAAQSFNGNLKVEDVVVLSSFQLVNKKALAGLRRINLEGLRWRVFDAKGQVLGRLASQISTVVQGKDKPTYTPNRDEGDMCIVINAKDVCVTGRKMTDKFYHWHTGYIGHLKERSLKDQMAKDPTEVIRKAVLRMLPRNKLRDDRDRKLRIFADSEHPFGDRPLEPYVMPARQVREMRPRARRAMIRAQKKAEQQEQGGLSFVWLSAYTLLLQYLMNSKTLESALCAWLGIQLEMTSNDSVEMDKIPLLVYPLDSVESDLVDVLQSCLRI